MAKEMKRVLRENTMLTPKQAKFLRNYGAVLKRAWLRQALLRLPGVYIKNDGLSASLNDMLLEVLHRASYAQDGQIVHLGAYDKEQICKSDSQVCAA